MLRTLRLMPVMLTLLGLALLASCASEDSPRPEVNAHGTWTFGIGKTL